MTGETAELPVASRALRRLLWMETASFVALMFVAMPLKYVWDVPQATRIAGSLHGLLFVLAVLGIAREAAEQDWPRQVVRRALLWLALPVGRPPI